MSSNTAAGTLSWTALSRHYALKVRPAQFISDLVYGDAAAADCLALHRLFLRQGFRAQIYAGRIDSHHAELAQSYEQYARQDGDLLIFHYTAWSEVAQLLLRQRWPLVLMYHNITPPEYFHGSDPQAEARARRGREELANFAPQTLLALGKSEYSRRELEAAGFPRTGVLPIALDFTPLHGPPNAQILRLFRDGYVNLLTVGRVVPNKKPEDIIKILYHYKRQINPKARLFLVGAHDAAGPYCRWLTALIERLRLSADVHFTGQVAFPDLLAYYRLADVYVSMSEHEGFGVPLVESMYLGVPIIAYAAAAVPFTMGDAGILVHQKNYAAIAEMIHLVITNQKLRQRLIAQGQQRAQDFSPEKVQAQLAAHLGEVLP